MYNDLLILWIIGILMMITEFKKVSTRSWKDQVCFLFLVNLPVILYINLVYLYNKEGYVW